MFKIDLHTHSVGSVDGGLSEANYRLALENKYLDAVAITDHTTIDFAKKLHSELGDQIIVGEEVMTQQGEIIGLYLQEQVMPDLEASEAVRAIHEQGGLVYIPHPFETIRGGCITKKDLEDIADQVDIIEIYNGRAIRQAKSRLVNKWAETHKKVGVASSDAHGPSGWGKTYTVVSEMPTCENLLHLLTSAQYRTGFIGIRGLLYPKANRLKNRVRRD